MAVLPTPASPRITSAKLPPARARSSSRSSSPHSSLLPRNAVAARSPAILAPTIDAAPRRFKRAQGHPRAANEGIDWGKPQRRFTGLRRHSPALNHERTTPSGVAKGDGHDDDDRRTRPGGGTGARRSP